MFDPGNTGLDDFVTIMTNGTASLPMQGHTYADAYLAVHTTHAKLKLRHFPKCTERDGFNITESGAVLHYTVQQGKLL